jgi:choline-phosphate cytidylyltransferase
MGKAKSHHLRRILVLTRMLQMTKSRQTNQDSSRHVSDDSDEDSDEKSPIRGRSGQVEDQVDGQQGSLVSDRSK